MTDAVTAKPIAEADGPSVLSRMLPSILIVFLCFFAIGLLLSVLPLHIHDGLGFGALAVGIVGGAQSAATLLTRRNAGQLCDQRGPRRAILAGSAATVAAGLAYAAAVLPSDAQMALGLILLGRLILGAAESWAVTGALAWAVGRAGAQNTGKVMALNGIAMYGAIAAGAPAGSALWAAWGFLAVSLAVALCGGVAFIIAAFMPAVPVAGGVRLSFASVMGRIAGPGLGLALGVVGFAVLASFLPLVYAARGWNGAGLALTAFGAAYIGVRLFAAGWPDRFGGRRVAVASLAVEAMGQALLWTAATPEMALAGAAVTGMGFSLLFPSLGVEAVGLVPPQNRGLAMGAYVAFFDLAMAVAAPAAGLLTGLVGQDSVFVAAALAALLAIPLVLVTVPARRGKPHA